MIKKICFFSTVVTFSLVSMETEPWQQFDRKAQVARIMSKLYEVTHTNELETDYKVRSYISEQLSRNFESEIFVNDLPTSDLLGQFFNFRQDAINHMPDEVRMYLDSLKKTSVGLATGSCIIATLLTIYTLWTCL